MRLELGGHALRSSGGSAERVHVDWRDEFQHLHPFDATPETVMNSIVNDSAHILAAFSTRVQALAAIWRVDDKSEAAKRDACDRAEERAT